MELPQLIFHAGVNIFAALLEQKANSSTEGKVAYRSRSICLFLQPPASHPPSCTASDNVSRAFWYITVSFSKMECAVVIVVVIICVIWNPKACPIPRHRSVNWASK